MPRKQDSQSGRFSEVYSDEDFLSVLAERGQAATSEIADTLGCSREHAYRRLRDLKDYGSVESRTVGGSKLWERVDGPSGVNPDDPFWNSAGMVSSSEGNLSTTVDQELYGPIEDSTE